MTITIPSDWTYEVSDPEIGPVAELTLDTRQVQIHENEETIDSLDKLKRAIEKSDGA